MDEKLREILEQYAFNVSGIGRGRGAFICDTDQGKKILREYGLSPARLIFESLVKYTIADRGYMNIDQIVVSKTGELFVKNKYDRSYVVRNWFDGKEGDLRQKSDVLSLAKNLSILHKVMRNVPLNTEMQKSYSYGNMKIVMEKHYKEMKLIRNYVKSQKQRNLFEATYLKYYEEFLSQGEKALELLERIGFNEILAQSAAERRLCHGDYSHHNVIFMKNGKMATVNFDRLHINIQVNDLYRLLRKVMEKNQWNIALGMDMISAYEQELLLTDAEKQYLFVLMYFPEKYWKIANHYYNTRKSWMCGRNQEKLDAFVEMKEQRQRFLEEFGKETGMTL